jgi:ABC-type transporter Mla subunit MlaD
VTRKKVPRPSDIRSAAESALETAQAVASGAMRVPPASAQIAAQLPDLLENLAAATERLNTTIDRMERYMALADPTFRTMDRLLPQLEALITTGNDVYRGLSSMPGVATLSRLAGLSSGDLIEPDKAPAQAAVRTKSGKANKPSSSKQSSRSSRRH